MNTHLRRSAGWLALLSLYVLAGRLCGAEYGPFTPRNSNGKASLKVVLQGVTPTLNSEFNAGKGLVIKNAANAQEVDGPRMLHAKRKKTGEVSLWYLKTNGCVIVYKPGKETLVIKLNRALPNQVLIATREIINYLVIDISDGPGALSYPYYYLDSAPPLDDVHKTTKIVLRKIPKGSFVMGSPTSELGRHSDETQHTVTLTQSFYLGVVEITQAQYWEVMGTNPAHFTHGAHGLKRPMDRVTWVMARGGTWPAGTPSGTSFIGRLRSKTGLNLDLPTEAQWEYACRAGTIKALNNNLNLQSLDKDPNLDVLGRYWHNGGFQCTNDLVHGAHAAVGSYLPNKWGLYDMHGNVWEWCLDWYEAYGGIATNPVGPVSGTDRVLRGGSWQDNARYCRSADRNADHPNTGWPEYGFRVCLPAAP